MRVSVLPVVGTMLLMVAGPLLAATDWDDCKAGLSDPDRAVAGCTRLIDSGLEAVHYRAVAYANRAGAYVNKKDNDRAIADASEAIRLDPAIAYAYANRAAGYANKADRDLAIADYSEVIRLDPRNMSAYFNRGRAHLLNRALPKAVADFNQASQLAPRDPYAALWLDIAGERSNLPSRLPQAVTRFDMTAWPAPVIRLFIGQLTPAAVLAAAEHPDATVKLGQVCETNFYSGEFALRGADTAEARRLFGLAARDCPKSFAEWEGANAELVALGVTP